MGEEIASFGSWFSENILSVFWGVFLEFFPLFLISSPFGRG